MKVALLGGSFDPPHIGHLFIAEEARVNLGYELVLFVPAAKPPHKARELTASAEHRIGMLQAATADRDDFLVDTWEITQGGTSYTIDTVRHLVDRFEVDGKLGLIIGDDLARDFSSWRDAETLVEMVQVVVAKRTGARFDKLLGRRHDRIDNSILAVSSSDIRERVRSERAFRYLVPDPVYEYVNKHGLYR